MLKGDLTAEQFRRAEERGEALAKVLQEHDRHCKEGEFTFALGCERHNYQHSVGWMCDGCDDHNFLFDPLSETHDPCEPWKTVTGEISRLPKREKEELAQHE